MTSVADTIDTLRIRENTRKNQVAQLLSDIRTAEGQIWRGKHDSARETLWRAAGHYPTCSFWNDEECDCGGWA